MRGCSLGYLLRTHVREVFPAYAGMFLTHSSEQKGDLRFPRVCGDVPIDFSGVVMGEKFSPRMRGCSAMGVSKPSH